MSGACLLALVILTLAGCGTSRSVIGTAAGLDSLPQLVTEPLRRGDLVELQLADGSRLIGRVQSFEPGFLLLRTAESRAAAPSLFGRKETLRIRLGDIQGGVRLGGEQPPALLIFLGATALGILLLGVT